MNILVIIGILVILGILVFFIFKKNNNKKVNKPLVLKSTNNSLLFSNNSLKTIGNSNTNLFSNNTNYVYAIHGAVGVDRGGGNYESKNYGKIIYCKNYSTTSTDNGKWDFIKDNTSGINYYKNFYNFNDCICAIGNSGWLYILDGGIDESTNPVSISGKWNTIDVKGNIIGATGNINVGSKMDGKNIDHVLMISYGNYILLMIQRTNEIYFAKNFNPNAFCSNTTLDYDWYSVTSSNDDNTAPSCDMYPLILTQGLYNNTFNKNSYLIEMIDKLVFMSYNQTSNNISFIKYDDNFDNMSNNFKLISSTSPINGTKTPDNKLLTITSMLYTTKFDGVFLYTVTSWQEYVNSVTAKEYKQDHNLHVTYGFNSVAQDTKPDPDNPTGPVIPEYKLIDNPTYLTPIPPNQIIPVDRNDPSKWYPVIYKLCATFNW